MNIRPKTKRRLIILVVGFLVVCSIGGGAFYYQRSKFQAKLRADRLAGMDAYHAGDYLTALKHLSNYVSKQKQDLEALFAYGMSRANVEEPNRSHIREGIGIFRALLDRDPNNLQAKKMLLDLWVKNRYDVEARALAEELLQRDPNDLDALRAAVLTMGRQGEYEEALKHSLHRNELAPQDIEGQLHTYGLFIQLRKPAEEVLKRAQDMRAANPDDPRFELLEGVAYRYAGDVKKAKELFLSAAQRNAPDTDFVKHLASQLEELQMFDESQDLLERSVAKSQDVELQRLLIKRLWQNGKYEQVLRRSEDLDPLSAKADSQLLGYRALTLYHLDRPSEAKLITAALAQRRTDSAAKAWATALDARFAPTDSDPKTLITALQQSLARDNDNPIIRFLLGEAFGRIGEKELAISAWNELTAREPSWIQPRILAARLLLESKRTLQAYEVSLKAYRLAPRQLDVRVTLAVAAFACMEEGVGEVDRAQIEQFIADIQRLAPGEPHTLPLHLTLLSRNGKKAEAADAIRAVLNSSRKPSQHLLLRLIAVDSAEKLGMQRELLTAADSTHGFTPQLALSRALELAREGKKEEGFKSLETAAAQATENKQDWEIALADYRERTGDPTAKDAWKTLGDNNPQDVSIQLKVLEAESIWSDRDFSLRTIERLKSLSGDDAIQWKIARARWLLGSTTNRDRDLAEAEGLLTDLVRRYPMRLEPRLLLAQTRQATGNRAGAIEQLVEAVKLRPSAAPIMFDLVRLLQQESRFDEARRYLTRLAETDSLTSDQRNYLAAMLSEQGDAQAAIALLEKTPPDQRQPAGQVMLANLYRMGGETTKAREIFSRLLDAPQLSYPVAESVVAFFASQEDQASAEKAIGKLPQGAGDGADMLLRAFYLERRGDHAKAEEMLTAAVQADPKNSRARQALIGFYLRRDEFAKAVSAADEGVKALPDDKELKILQARAEVLAADPAAVDLRPLIEKLALDPSNAAVAETLDVISKGRQKTITPEQVTQRLRQISDQNPRFFELQSLLAQRYLQQGNAREAVTIATRAMEAFPTAPEPARLATAVFARLNRWRESLAAAQRWRDRSMHDTTLPDLAIAEAYIRLGEAANATRQLEPHISRAKENPDGNRTLYLVYVRALLFAGRENQAYELLEPMMKNSSAWRTTWLELAGTMVQPADAALRWIDAAAPLVDPKSTDESVYLANAWHQLGQRSGNEEHSKRAETVLSSLGDRLNDHADGLVLRAVNSERLGKLKDAEQQYRQALAVDPKNPIALNNLAFLLYRTSGDMNEAKTFASRAVEAAPDQPNFLDTLARIQSRLGDRDTAIATFERARTLAPDNLDVLIGYADTLIQAGRRDQAASILSTIDTLLRTQPLPESLRPQLESIRAALQANAEAS